MTIMISLLKEHYISADQSRYDKCMFAKYLYTSTIKDNSKFHKSTLPHDMISTEEYASTIDEQVEVLSIEYNIQYKSFVSSSIFNLYLSGFMFFCTQVGFPPHQILVK